MTKEYFTIIGKAGKSTRLAQIGFIIMWSSGFIGARLGTPEASTPTLMAWRFFVAAGILFALVLALRHPLPSLRTVVLQGLLGLLAQGVYLSGVVGAVEFGVTAGISALVAALQPIFAATLAGPILKEHVVRQQWIGLVIGLVGVILVIVDNMQLEGNAPLWAYIMPFVGMAGLVTATLLERKIKTDTPLDVALTIQCGASAFLFAMLATFWGGLEPVGGISFWTAVAWFVIFSTFGGYGFYWLNLKLIGVTQLSSLVYLTPPTTMIWAHLMFGERIGLLAMVGLAVCFYGVFLANQEKWS